MNLYRTLDLNPLEREFCDTLQSMEERTLEKIKHDQAPQVSAQRDYWAEAGIPYNIQDTLVSIVHLLQTSGISIDEFVARNAWDLQNTRKEFKAERLAFRAYAN